MDLDNPLLAWMLDSDAVTTVLRVCLFSHSCTVCLTCDPNPIFAMGCTVFYTVLHVAMYSNLCQVCMCTIVLACTRKDAVLITLFCTGVFHYICRQTYVPPCLVQFSKAFQGLPQDRIEEAFDRFAREEFHQGHQIVKEGEPISKMYIVKMGELACTSGGHPVTAIQEAGGFSYFGEQAVLANEPSPVTITVQSESCLLLGASRRALAQLMGQGPAVMGISADDAALASSALKATAALQDLSDTEIKVCSVLHQAHVLIICASLMSDCVRRLASWLAFNCCRSIVIAHALSTQRPDELVQIPHQAHCMSSS